MMAVMRFRTIHYLSVIFLSISMAGCAAVIAGAAVGTGVAYVMGGLEAEVGSSPEQLARASEKALRNLNMRDITAEVTSLDAKISGYTAENKKISIDIKRQTENISKITIRIGTFGDKQTSQLVYEEIRKNLP